MGNRSVIIVLFTILSLTKLVAQPCGFDHIMEEMIKNDPAKKKQIDLHNSFLQNLQLNSTQTLSGNNATYIVPVVVHIVHDYGVSNISDAQVYDAIRILNEDFNKSNADTSSIVSQFKSIAANIGIEFRLATIDPDGKGTKGITRTFSYKTNSAKGEEVKDLISWDTKKYYNIWVVNYLGSGIGAYSYIPGTAPSPSHEGTIAINRSFGSIGTSYGTPSANHTLSHETGHFLGLYHTWGLGTVGANCNGSDYISDTPPTKGSSGTCVLNQNGCGSLENVQNFMDYGSCSNMFTEGQKAVMISALTSAAGDRNKLYLNSNLIATGTEDNHTVNEYAPIADFRTSTASYPAIDSTIYCEGSTVHFLDLSYNDSLSTNRVFEWSFPGGTPSSSTDINPIITYNTAGIFDVQLIVSNSAGRDTLKKSNYILILSTSVDTTAHFFEGFENASFPEIPGSENEWILYSPGSEKFKRTTVTRKTGSASLEVNLNTESGLIGLGSNKDKELWHLLISPNFNLSSFTDSIYLSFNYAYAQVDNYSNDYLRVLYLRNCGIGWQLSTTMSNSQIDTKNTNVTTEYIPSISEWGYKEIDLSSKGAGQSDFRIMFAVSALRGNKFYLDNVNFYHDHVGISDVNTLNFGSSIYPNPANESSVLDISGNQSSFFVIEIYDALGKIIGESVKLNGQASYKIPLEQLVHEKSSGIYYVKIINESGVETIKIVF